MSIRFRFEPSSEWLTSHSGLSAVGMLLSNTFLKQRLNYIHLPEVEFPEISHGDVMTSYLGLPVQGKNDFEHIEPL